MKLRYLLPALLLGLLPVTQSHAFVGISVNFGPPAIPVYEQPPCPTPGYLWTPGYYVYDPTIGDYYWVDGVWVAPPRVGYLWTPGYWGYSGGAYGYNPGYWGTSVGFYGGVNYGFGYDGYGYGGGRWEGNRFAYNTAVTRVNTTVINNTYVDKTIIRENASRTSFNGGPNGLKAKATPQQLAAAKGPHVGAVAAQNQHREQAKQQHAANPGRPANRPGGPKAAGNENKPGQPAANNKPGSPADVAARREARREKRGEAAAANKPGAEKPAAAIKPAAAGDTAARREARQAKRAEHTAASKPAAAERQIHREAARPVAHTTRQVAHAAPHAASRPQPHAAPRPQPHAAAPHGGGKKGGDDHGHH